MTPKQLITEQLKAIGAGGIPSAAVDILAEQLNEKTAAIQAKADAQKAKAAARIVTAKAVGDATCKAIKAGGNLAPADGQDRDSQACETEPVSHDAAGMGGLGGDA